METDYKEKRADDPIERMWFGRLYSMGGPGPQIVVDTHPYPKDNDFDIDFVMTDVTDREIGPAPYDAEGFPEPYRDVRDVELLGRTDTVEVEFSTMKRRPLYDDWFQYKIITEESEAIRAEIDLCTLVAPAADDAFQSRQFYRPIHSPSPVDAETTSTIRQQMLDALDDDQLDALAERGLEKLGDLEVGAAVGGGEFRGERHIFATAHAAWLSQMEPTFKHLPLVRAAMFLTQTGEVTELVDFSFGEQGPYGDLRSAEPEPRLLADPEGDTYMGVAYKFDELHYWVDVDRQGDLVKRRI